MQTNSPLISFAKWGCLALSALFFAQFADMLFAWPFGSILGAGQWVHVGQGKQAGWQFHFHSGLAGLHQSFLWGTGALFVLAHLYSSRLKSRYQKPRNPRCKEIPSADSALALSGLLAKGESEILVEFESSDEQAVRLQAKLLFGGLFLWFLGLQIGSLVVGLLPLAPMSSARFFLVGVCLVPGLDFVLRGLRAMRRALEIDERLLFQFSRQEVGLIDCQAVDQAQPKKLLSFAEIREVQLVSIRDDKEELSALKIMLEGGQGEPVQVGTHLTVAQQGIALEAAEKLATCLGKPLAQREAGLATT